MSRNSDAFHGLIDKFQEALSQNETTQNVQMEYRTKPRDNYITFWYTVPDSEDVESVVATADELIKNTANQIYSDMDSSLNSAIGSADDRQDACSQVTVHKSFPDDKVFELKDYIEGQLAQAGYNVTMYQVSRPSSSVIEFDYEIAGASPTEADAVIEQATKSFVDSGYSPVTSTAKPDETIVETEETVTPEISDDESLDSSKEEMNCAVENARVEQTEQGTFVVKADTDRFGKDAILYEHYSEEGANKYLDKLKRGGEMAAAGYTRSDLNCSEGINPAKLTTDGIAKAMSKSILEDPDCPLVMIPISNETVVFIAPAGYEDNDLVSQGKYPEATVYVEIFNRDQSATRQKMLGSEAADFIKNYLEEDQATE